MEKIPKFDKHRAFNKAVGPGKNPKLISLGPTFIPDYRVLECSKIPLPNNSPSPSRMNKVEELQTETNSLQKKHLQLGWAILGE